MGTYTIGEVAERSGFSASSLRYYEGIGLVAPVTRTAAGYRVYDDHTLTRLAFIDRAKQLGCSLDEITDLVGIWDGERCAPVQRRFHDLVTAKLTDAHRQIAELTAFTAQLHTAATQLSGQPPDGPCDAGCACLADTTVAAPVASMREPRSDVPIACTLDTASLPERLADWQDILGHATTRTAVLPGGLRIEFDRRLAVADLARLVATEQQCCAFFSFAITVDTRGIALEVHAPSDAAEVLAALFGAPSP